MTLRKKKMDSDMQKLPLMSHGGPAGHVPRAGLYWYNLLAGRSAGRLASARRPHLLIEDALLLGLRFGPLTTFLAALLACLLVCGLLGLLLLTKPVKARRRGGGRWRRRPRVGLLEWLQWPLPRQHAMHCCSEIIFDPNRETQVMDRPNARLWL